MKRIFATLAAVALFACATTVPPKVQDGALRAVGVSLASYGATQRLMLQYGSLPACAPGNGLLLCRDEKVVARMKQIDREAVLAIRTAQVIVNTGQGDPSALAVATSLINTAAGMVADAYGAKP